MAAAAVLSRDAAGRYVAETRGETHLCRGCDRTLPRDAFAPRPKRPRGITSRCRDCLRADARERQAAKRAADPEGHNARWRAWSRTATGRAYLRTQRERRRGNYASPEARRYADEVLAHDPCSYCGGAGGVIDHVTALARGGSGEAENLTAACAPCNSRKSTTDLLTFLMREANRG